MPDRHFRFQFLFPSFRFLIYCDVSPSLCFLGPFSFSFASCFRQFFSMFFVVSSQAAYGLRPRWTPDSEVSQCTHCDINFWLFKRRVSVSPTTPNRQFLLTTTYHSFASPSYSTLLHSTIAVAAVEYSATVAATDLFLCRTSLTSPL